MIVALLFALTTREALPASVDLRAGYSNYHLAVCQQNGPLCWDYTVVGLLEYELAAQRHAATRLSPGFLSWAASATDAESNAGSNFGRAYRGLEKYGIAPLSLGGDPDADGRGRTPSEATLRVAAGLARVDIHWIRFWNNHDELTTDQLQAIKSEIADGHPVAVGMRWPNKTTFSPPNSYVLTVPARDDIFDGHCVALVGYKEDANLPGSGAFLFRNSWGADWADHGYAWMPYDLLKFCVNDSLSVRVGPAIVADPLNAINFEAENLATSDGQGNSLGVQDMTRFGQGWGGGKQLFFQAHEGGDFFSLHVPVKEAGRYQLRLFITRAEDYGKFRIDVDGQAEGTVPVVVDGAGPGVMRSDPIPYGTFHLKAGDNRLTFTVIGRDSASGGFFVGLDSLQLVPAS